MASYLECLHTAFRRRAAQPLLVIRQTRSQPREAAMGMLVPIGVLLIVLGAGGGIAACYGSEIFDDGDTMAAQMEGQTGAASDASSATGAGLYVAPFAGLFLAIGLVCVGIGMGHWRRPVPSEVRPANPWSDQPGEHGDPPVGQV
jgi:hypothetical protein